MSRGWRPKPRSLPHLFDATLRRSMCVCLCSHSPQALGSGVGALSSGRRWSHPTPSSARTHPTSSTVPTAFSAHSASRAETTTSRPCTDEVPARTPARSTGRSPARHRNPTRSAAQPEGAPRPSLLHKHPPSRPATGPPRPSPGPSPSRPPNAAPGPPAEPPAPTYPATSSL